MNNKTLNMVMYLLLVVGGLNWGLVGAFNINLVEMLLGDYPTLEMIVYVLVGLSAVYSLMMHKTDGMYSGKKK